MSVIQNDTKAAAKLGRELRQDRRISLSKRRSMMGLCLTSMASLGVVALYQFGVLKRLPAPPLRGLDADKVNGSAQAYEHLSMPDAVLGLGSYSVTLGLVAMGGADRESSHPWIPVALGVKASLDSALSAKLTVDQARKYRAFSLWSLVAAGATFGMLPLVIPEARAALRRLIRRA